MYYRFLHLFTCWFIYLFPDLPVSLLIQYLLISHILIQCMYFFIQLLIKHIDDIHQTYIDIFLYSHEYTHNLYIYVIISHASRDVFIVPPPGEPVQETHHPRRGAAVVGDGLAPGTGGRRGCEEWVKYGHP